jgi:hypothetical protein
VSRCVMDSVCSLRSVAVWPSHTMSIQFPVKLHVMPAILMSVLASARVLLMLFVICALSCQSLIRGGESKTNVSLLGWCCARGFWVLG